MNIQIIATIASSLVLANASNIPIDVKEDIFHAAYTCNHLLLRGPLVKAKNQVGGKKNLDICFKNSPYLYDHRASPTFALNLNDKTPFQAMLLGAKKGNKSPEDFVNTYEEFQAYTFRAECEGDYLVDEVFGMPGYGIEVATKLIKSGASPLGPYGESVLSRAFSNLGSSADDNGKVLLFLAAVLDKPKNVQLLQSKGCNPIAELGAFSLKSYNSGLILKKLLAKGFTIDGKAVESWVRTAFNTVRHTQFKDDPNPHAEECARRINRVMADFFNAMENPFMSVGSKGRLQTINQLLANAGHYYDEHTDDSNKVPSNPELQTDLQDFLDEARRGKDVVLDPHGRQVTITYVGEPGKDVVVTGTFDGWSQSIEMMPVAGHPGRYEKKFKLKEDEEYQYKFVVDGQWSTQGANVKDDGNGNTNNYI